MKNENRIQMSDDAFVNLMEAIITQARDDISDLESRIKNGKKITIVHKERAESAEWYLQMLRDAFSR